LNPKIFDIVQEIIAFWVVFQIFLNQTWKFVVFQSFMAFIDHIFICDLIAVSQTKISINFILRTIIFSMDCPCCCVFTTLYATQP